MKKVNINKRLRGSTYYADYMLNGKRTVRSLGTKDETVADRKIRLLDAQLNGTSNTLTFADYCGTYLAVRATKSPRSQERTERYFKVLFIPEFGDRPLQSIGMSDVDSFLSRRLSTPVRRFGELVKRNPSSVKPEYAHLHAFFSYALADGKIQHNPMANIAKPKAMACDVRDKVLTVKEIERLLIRARKYREVWRLALNTGMRRQELLNIVIDRDVDLDNRQLTIRSTEDRSTKSGKTRVVPLNDQAMMALKMLVKRSRFRSYGGFLLKQVEATTLYRAFKSDCKRAGISGKATLHWTRHSFISAYVNAPGNLIQDAQELAGHADIQTTMLYVHTKPESKARGVANLKF